MIITLNTDSDRKIAMIKEFRGLFSSGLREAKEFVEALMEHPSNTLKVPASIASILPDEIAVNNSMYFRITITQKTIIEEIKNLSKQCIDVGSYDIATDLINILERN